MDSVSQTPDMKQCARGEKCVHPDGPLLPVSEFYRHTNGKYFNSYCKACAKENNKKQTRRTKKTAGEPGERIAIEKLKSMGVYAAPGKSSEFTHVDIVAWGCVRIEVKQSDKKSDGTWNFAFSSQRHHGIKADLILLIAVDGDSASFHLFSAGHPVFYKNGHVKNSVPYMPYTHHRKRGEYLSSAVMNEHKDAWHLIEQKRLEIQKSLIAGEFKPKELRNAEPMQPRLFDVA